MLLARWIGPGGNKFPRGCLEGYVSHSNRHTFASRCVMVGMDARTLQELGGWKSLVMVSRYSHLAPAYLQAAVERIVVPPAEAATRR